jgi:2-polyprenyl-3-methyl-5-hydroxy-6-metoxy-1,4-benzoquinol methylase
MNTPTVEPFGPLTSVSLQLPLVPSGTSVTWIGGPVALAPAVQVHPLPAADGMRFRTPHADARRPVVILGPIPSTLSADTLLALVVEAGRIAGGLVAILATDDLPCDRTWLENAAFLVNLRKHPAFQTTAPAELAAALAPCLPSESPAFTVLLFEKIPPVAAARHPLAALRAERDLHNDMLREPGRRAEAHTRRYTLAREFVIPGMRILDAACGLGYGAPILRAHPDVTVTGVDCSKFAVAYASLHYGRTGSADRFLQGDATKLDFAADATFDLVTSFETIEHVIDPEAFLTELARVLKPGGRLVLSVPNRWIDQDGKNPVPWHLHVYDFAQLARQVGVHFQLEHVHRQNAGGGWKREQPDGFVCLPSLEPSLQDREDAEWWVIVARRKTPGDEPRVSNFKSEIPVSKTRSPRLLVLDETARHSDLYGRALGLLGATLLPVPDSLDADAVVSLAPDVVLLSREWTPEWRLVAAACRRVSIPVIYVMDGVIEWSYLWNNQSYIRPGGTFLQPMLADHLCVIGRHPARILASLGLAPRTHLIGLPRLDTYDRTRRVTVGAMPRLLIATARTAGHDPEQQLMARRALRDLKAFFDAQPALLPVWRIAADLAEDIGVVPDIAGSLSDALAEASALITFPSTCVLEAMLKGVPVAQLDYRPVPLYVATAWEIRSPDHIPAIVQELLYPPPQKLAWQQACLADELEAGDASARLAEVVATAIRERGVPAEASPTASSGALDFHQVHSELSTFSAAPAAALSYELDAAHRLLRQAREQRVEHTRDAVELVEAALAQDLRDLRRHALIDHLPQATVHTEFAGSVSAGPATLNGRTCRTVFMAAPARATWTLPTGAEGLLALAVSVHPDVWNQAASGPVRFTVQIDGTLVTEVELDVLNDPSARRWHWLNIPVAASAHPHTLELSALGLGDQAYRWTLWRNPLFLWTDTAGAAQDPSMPAAALRPDYYVPNRTVV